MGGYWDSLKQAARAEADRFGHRLGPFRSDLPTTAYSNCEDLRCGLGVVIDIAPRRPKLAITGDAVSTLCGGVVAEERARVETRPPPRHVRVVPAAVECQVCGKPTDGRATCSDACTHEFRIRTSREYARGALYGRDRGRCARCGLDTAALERDLLELGFRDQVAYNRLVVELQVRGFPPHRVEALSVWDMAHKTAVAEGGGGCGLDNLETLCLPCHARETTVLNARLAERREREAAAVAEFIARNTPPF